MANGISSPGSTTAVTPPASTDPEVRLLLVCQAEGLRNRYQNLAGYEPFDDNSGLTALGWEQANLLAAWLKTHERIDVLVSAPQLRSRLTAQRIGQVCGIPVKVQPDLPRHAFERIKAPGGSNEATKFPLDVHAIDYPVDEEYQQFSHSVIASVDKIVRENWGKTVAVVMSGMAIAATLRYFLGSTSLGISIMHTGISELTRRNQQWQLLYINRREHMPVTTIAGQLTPSANDDKSSEAEDLRPVSYAYDRIAATVNSLSETERAQYEKIQNERLQRQRQLLKFGQLPPDLSVIEIGAGSGQLSQDLAQDGAEEVVGIDISAAMLEAAEYQRLSRTNDTAERVSFRLAAANAIPFADARFDAAIMHTLLHHSQKPASILQEIGRVLKSNGILLLAELIGSDDAVKRATYNAIEERRSPAHAQVRTAEQLRKLITAAGFTIEAEKVVTFDRDFDEWLNEYLVDETRREVVRKMVEAGFEANAAGLNVRRQGERLMIEQKLLYAKARRK
ncbi:MAG: methyltransferase domain-containing protein [Caldilineaceae bacterium]